MLIAFYNKTLEHPVYMSSSGKSKEEHIPITILYGKNLFFLLYSTPSLKVILFQSIKSALNCSLP